jgi:hypothetical protein
MRRISYYGLLATATLLSVPCLAKNDIPLVYDVEFTGAEYEVPVFPTLEEAPEIKLFRILLNFPMARAL